MRGLTVFLVFFTIFLASSLAIPSPLFPGNAFCVLLKLSNYTPLVSAVVNGAFYGFIVWIVFNLTFRWIEQTLSKNKLTKKE